MEINVDTKTGSISVSSSTPYTIGELLHALEYFHPDLEWKELETSSSLYLTVTPELEPSMPTVPETSYQKKRRKRRI